MLNLRTCAAQEGPINVRAHLFAANLAIYQSFNSRATLSRYAALADYPLVYCWSCNIEKTG